MIPFYRNASLGKPFDVVNTDNETVEEDLGQKKKKLIDSSKEVSITVDYFTRLRSLLSKDTFSM